MQDSIAIIKATEAQAEQIVLQAKETAKSMIAETEHSCEVFLEREKEFEMKDRERKLISLNEKSKELLESNVKLSEKAAKDFYDSHKPKLHSAVEIILQEIEKQCL